MHSKIHFKFPFKSSKISTVSIKTIFFLNTRLPKEHYQIYFTIFEATKLEIQLLQNSIETWNICTILLLNGHWQAGPTCQRGPRVSDKKNRGRLTRWRGNGETRRRWLLRRHRKHRRALRDEATRLVPPARPKT